MLKSTTTPALNPKSKVAEERIVYKLSKNTIMKFRPERVVEDGGILSRIKSLSKIFSRQDAIDSENIRKSNDSQGLRSSFSSPERLRFLFRLDNQTYLIGNNQQLDAINISVVEDYIESEQLWTLRPKSTILNLLADDRRKAMIVVLAGEIQIYSYEGKKSKKPPKLEKTFRVLGEVKMMQLAKDSLLTVFFQDSVHSYFLDGANSRQNSRKQYKVDKSLALFQLAQCIQNVLNVFFWCPSKNNEKYFELWCMGIEILPQKLIIGEIKKIYDIENSYKQALKIESITKDSYFMNLGQSILMFRKGYCVDKVIINLQVKGTILKYFGDKKLIHVSPLQIDFYNVLIDLIANPPKLSIQSFDSISNLDHKKYMFLDAIKFQEHKIGFFYQHPVPNNSGEVKYFFTLTQKWKFEEKIDSILPKISEYNGKYDGNQFKQLLNQIEVSCDVVGKMGMSRKEAYLRIWRQSKKEQVEQFKLLLDTLDYNTIREQILLKLRKKSMLFNQVHKIQSGCLGMIGNNLFSPKSYSIDQLKNYLISHFLIRKLDLFKDIKLYEKKVGKIKLSETETNQKNKDKLMINIQQYTSVVKMDIKAYLLELIYNFTKYKKGLITQIRIVIRKFRFAFLFIYENLLKEISNVVKEDLLYLLQNIPQLLPYTHKIEGEQQEISLKQGLWGKIKDEEWENSLYLQNVATVYNKEMIGDFMDNIWIKRYWLTYHDMIFLNRASIQNDWNKIRGQYMFYNLIQHIFDNYTNQTKILELIYFIEETYISFPPHLFNNVMLYRQLYQYFKKNQVMNDSFQTFLRNTDQEIFKKIFDHQKFKKGSFLKDIKPIYENLKQSDKFNVGLLKYFSSNLSEVSDIKYLLNRINNQKKEFHDENIEMYEVLVKGMQIKLKLGSQKDIPISQVLIYIENIPLTEDNAVSKELKILQKINEEGQKFKKMKLNMSVFQMIRNRDSVLINSISYQIQNSGLRTNHEQSFVLEKSKQIIDELTKIRRNIYGPFQDNVLLFIFVIKLVETKELIQFVHRIIEQNTNEDCIFDNGHLQSAVLYCYRQKLMNEPIYRQSQPYLSELIKILPQDNTLRIFIKNELELALIFSQSGQSIKFPICGESGLISKSIIQGILEPLSKQALLEINMQVVYELSSTMQKITGQSSINLYELYEFHFSCLLRKGALHRALEIIQLMITLQPENINNIIYPIMVFKWISCEFIDQNKTLMISLLAILFKKPRELLKVYQQLMSKSFSNEDQKFYLTQTMSLNALPSQQKIKIDNILFNDDFIEYLKQNPDKIQKCVELFNNQFNHLIHTSEDFAKSVDILIYHLLIVQQPVLLVKYVHYNRYTLNIKEVRCFMGHLCKYEAYDSIKVLEFSKRMFKLLYDVEKKQGDFKKLIQDVTSTPLLETRSIDSLDTTSDALSKLAKSIEKIKNKLKYKMSSSSALRKRASLSGIVAPSKFQKIEEFLNDPQKYFQKNDYPFNDSDGYVEKKQFLSPQKFKQGSDNLSFSYKKYLTWLFSRTNQQIEYYLLKANEAEADEAIRLQQQALKLSFRKSPNDKGLKDNAQIVMKAYEKITDPRPSVQKSFGGFAGITGLAAISAIPAVASSAISLNQIWTQEVEEVYLGTTLLKEEILSTIKIEEDKLTFDTKIIQRFGTSQQIQAALPDLVKEIYNDGVLDYGTATALIRQIYNVYPKITPVNVAFLEIYSKVEQLQKKLGLNLQTKDLLPFQGLLIKQKDSNILFNFIKGFVLPHLNESNVHTLSRIISLSFKKPEFQQQIINEYFKITVKEYNELDNEFDENMKLQKIGALAQKMPLNHLKLEIEKIIEVIINPQKQRKVIKAISEILRQRNDAKNAELLEKQWLNDKIASPEDIQ